MFVTLAALLCSHAFAQDSAPPAEEAPAEEEASTEEASAEEEEPAPKLEVVGEEPATPAVESRPPQLEAVEGDTRRCFPIVVGSRRFKCGTTSGRIWNFFGVGSSQSLQAVMKDYPPARRKLILADGLKIGGTVVNAGTAVVSGVVLYKVIRNAATGEPIQISIGEIVVMLAGGIVGSGANSLAKSQLENAIEDYNFAPTATRWGVSPGAVAGADGKLVPTLGAHVQW